MSVKKQPVFLDITKIYLPITALVSIMHRISGLVLLILAPLWVAFLYTAVYDITCLSDYLIYFKCAMALSAVLYFYHLLAGGRHIMAEVCHCHSLQSSRRSALWALVIWFIISGLFLLRVFL